MMKKAHKDLVYERKQRATQYNFIQNFIYSMVN